MNVAVVPSVAVTGCGAVTRVGLVGGITTVSVAEELVTLPAVLLTFTVYPPASVACTVPRVNVGPVCPPSAEPFRDH